MAAFSSTKVISRKMSTFKVITALLFWVILPCAVCTVEVPALSYVLPPLCSHKIPEQKINTALLNISNSAHSSLIVFLQTEQCYKCDLVPVVRVEKNSSCIFQIDSRWPMRVEIKAFFNNQTHTLSLSCSEASLTDSYVEGGVYYIKTKNRDHGNISCEPGLINDPPNPNIAIYVALAVGFMLNVLWILGKYLYRKGYIHRVLCFWSTESMMSDLGSPTNINQIEESNGGDGAPAVKERLKSLDTFRGISIVIMIFVNYRGGKYWFFAHSRWNGLTVADLVFPWFVFIMGTAMAFSLPGQVRRGIPKWQILLRILKRSAILFLIGLLINSFGVKNGVDFDNLRIPGVLQRFAGTYLITASVFVIFFPSQNINQFSGNPAFHDLTLYWPEWCVHLTLVAIHCALTFAMPMPGCPRGYLGPGGLEQGGKYFNCTGGAAGLIDRKFFGSQHMYQRPTSTEIYHQTLPYDPEGLLGTLMSCFMCFLGLQAGKILKVHTDWVKRCRRFIIWMVITCALALLLSKATLNDGWVPINKNLWSLSYVMALSSMAFFLFMVCYLLIDVFKVWSGAPFYYAGMNAIALYCGHEFFAGRAPVSFVVPKTHASLLMLNLWGTAFWVLVSIYFYYKDIFITV